MECPVPEGAPTLTQELRRGVNPYNLKFGAVASLVLGVATGTASQWGVLPLLLPNPWLQGLAATAVLFLLLTLLHTCAHGFMGWLFEQGLQAHCRGEYAKAAWLLALADKPGMDHYDPHGVARAALLDSRGRR